MLEELLEKAGASPGPLLQYKTSEDEHFNIYINQEEKKDKKESQEKKKPHFSG